MLLWRGFGYRWRFTSHRMPILGSWLEAEPVPRHRFALRIGAFPHDTADARAHAVSIEDQRVLPVARGRTELHLAGHIAWPSTASKTVSRSDWPDIPPTHELVAILDGFQIAAIDSPAGWHMGGLGMGVQLSQAGSLTVSARLRPAESPHPGIFGLGSWTWDQEACHSVTVGWRVLAVPAGLASNFVLAGGASHTLRFGQSEWEEGADSLGGKTILLRGFDFAVDAPPWLQRRSGYLRNLNGRYVRALAAGIARTEAGDRPDVELGNAPHGIVRFGALFLQYGVLVLALVVLIGVPEYRELGAAVLVGLALVTRAWPSIWYQAPAVPFSVTSSLRCVALDVEGEALTSTHFHVTDDDSTSLGPEMRAVVERP